METKAETSVYRNQCIQEVYLGSLVCTKRQPKNLPSKKKYKMHNKSLTKEHSPTSIDPAQKMKELMKADFILD